MSAEIYQGTVLTANDPLKLGRVKIAIPQISGTAASTWATPTVRSPNQPAAGSTVWVNFDLGDPARPVFHTGPPPAANGGMIITTSTALPPNPYPGMQAFLTDTGQPVIYISASAGWQESSGRIVCTTTTLPATPYQGMEVYTTDTGQSMIYISGSWIVQSGWTAWTALTGSLGTDWAIHTAQYRTGPGGIVELRGSLTRVVSPSVYPETMCVLPTALSAGSSAPDMWWPCTYAPGAGDFGTTNVALNGRTSLVLYGAISFSGGFLWVNLSPITYSTV